MKTFVAFFEIPAINMERAVQFYGTVFGEKLEIVEYGEEKMAFISSGDQQPIGCIFSLKGYLPTSNSITISFYTENIINKEQNFFSTSIRIPKHFRNCQPGQSHS